MLNVFDYQEFKNRNKKKSKYVHIKIIRISNIRKIKKQFRQIKISNKKAVVCFAKQICVFQFLNNYRNGNYLPFLNSVYYIF